MGSDPIDALGVQEMGSDPICLSEVSGVIETRRGLLVLLAIAALLAVLVVRETRRPPPEIVDRAIVPGLDPDRITDLVWDRSPLPEVKVTRQNEWRWVASGEWARADARLVRDVLAALRGARWHRRAEVSAAGKVHVQLSATVGTATRVIGIGAPIEGTEQQWLVVGDHALLVDRWVARALDPDPFALRVKRPMEDASQEPSMTVQLFFQVLIQIDGQPRRLERPRTVLPRPELLAALYRAVEEIEIVRLSRPPPSETKEVLEVRTDGSMRLSERCPDDPALAWVSSSIGDGCVTRAAYDALIAAAMALNPPAVADVIELRPAPFEPSSVTLADGTLLDLSHSPVVAGKPADPAAVAELLSVLFAPAEVGPASTTPSRSQMTMTFKDGGSITLELLGDGLVRRADEEMALKLTPAAYAVLTRGAKDLADRSVWTEEPTTIMAIQIDGITYARGAVIGEWSRTPAGPVDGARVEALVTALSTLKRSPDVASFTKANEVTLVVAGAAGAPVRHVLTVGARVQGGCTAWAGNQTVRLPAPVCASVTALAK
jgi:hypothetical protein